jgi:two-component system phosphate regulon response regulator PhoB
VSEPTEGRRDVPELTLVPAQSAVRAGGREVALTPTQFRLLAVLLEQPGRAYTRAELVERGIGDLVTERTVDVHVKDLRRRLGEWGPRVVAVRGVGYRYQAGAGQEVG